MQCVVVVPGAHTVLIERLLEVNDCFPEEPFAGGRDYRIVSVRGK